MEGRWLRGALGVAALIVALGIAVRLLDCLAHLLPLALVAAALVGVFGVMARPRRRW